ncbi:unnamed protein product, partial [Mesorhabditis spiculigera]
MEPDGFLPEEVLTERREFILNSLNQLYSEADKFVIPPIPEKKPVKADDHHIEFPHHENKRLFRPPLQVQRNRHAYDKLFEAKEQGVNVKKIAVLGCGALSFERYLSLNLHRIGAEHVISIDICYEDAHHGVDSLKNYAESHKRLFGRIFAHPAIVEVWKGDIKEFHNCLNDVDVVICLEVIEHMPLEDADKVLFNILHNIKPKVAIISTPNHEYNQKFPGMDKKFRHDDHHFEFNTVEFTEWTERLRKGSGYSAEVDYVGYLENNESDSDGGFCPFELQVKYAAKYAKESGKDPVRGGATQFVVYKKVEAPTVDVVPHPRDSSSYSRIGCVLIPYGKSAVLRFAAQRSLCDYLEAGKHNEETLESLCDRTYYPVYLRKVIAAAEPKYQRLLREYEEEACINMSNGSHNYIAAMSKEVDGEAQWILHVPDTIPVKELCDYLRDVDY